MRSQTAATQGVGSVLSIRRGRQEVSAQGKENFGRPGMHGLNSTNSVMAMRARRLEIKLGSKLVEKRVGGPFPNSHCAIALHIAVSPNRAKACARLSDLPAQ